MKLLTQQNKLNQAYIYSLTDPRDNLIKYVGKTIDLNYRYKSHLWKNKNDRTEKNHWIQMLLKCNLTPIMEVIDVVPENEWQLWEQYWISQMKVWGFDLKNGDNGGLGFNRFDDKVKGKISKTLTGRKCPEFHVCYDQYSLSGEFIKSYNSLKEIKEVFNLRKNDSNISTAFRTRCSAYGFLWIKSGFDHEVWLKEHNARKVTKSKNSSDRCHLMIKHHRVLKFSDKSRLKMSIAKIGKAPWNKKISQ